MSMEDYNFAKAREAWATPVKIVQYNCLCGRTMKFESEHGVIAPQRTWVGLTDEDMSEIEQKAGITEDDDGYIVSQIFKLTDAKLKDKNSG